MAGTTGAPSLRCRRNEAGTMARGIAVLSSDVDAATLESLHACGIRGVRFNQTLGSTSLDDLEPLRP